MSHSKENVIYILTYYFSPSDSKQLFSSKLEKKDSSPVVRKPINAKKRIKFNRRYHFSCSKCFEKLILNYMQRQVKVETKGQKCFRKISIG